MLRTGAAGTRSRRDHPGHLLRRAVRHGARRRAVAGDRCGARHQRSPVAGIGRRARRPGDRRFGHRQPR